MEDFQVEKVKKVVTVVGTVIGVGLIVWLFGSLSSNIVNNGYKPEDVIGDYTQSVVLIPEDKPLEKLNLKTAKDVTDAWGTVRADSALDALISKSAMLLTCETSPFKEMVSTVEYVSSKNSIGYRIEWVTSDYTFGCMCTSETGNPNLFTKNAPFTEAEKEFLTSLGGLGDCVEEVHDGLYEIYYS